MADEITDEELAELVRGVTEAAQAIIRGDLRAYVDFINHADDYTLMAPSGGEPRRGFDDSPEALEALSRYFRGGEAELEVFASYTSGNLAVLVAIERQHGVVGDPPDQDLSLRVTLVFFAKSRGGGDSCIAMPTHWSTNWDKISCRLFSEATANAGSAASPDACNASSRIGAVRRLGPPHHLRGDHDLLITL